MADRFVIVVDRATAAQLNVAHETIKAAAHGWWHHFEAMWVVGDDLSAPGWRDLVRDALAPATNARVAVFKISETYPRWAISGSKGNEWFYKTFK